MKVAPSLNRAGIGIPDYPNSRAYNLSYTYSNEMELVGNESWFS